MLMQSHSDDSLVYRTVPLSARALAHARPTMSCIPLVLIPICMNNCSVFISLRHIAQLH